MIDLSQPLSPETVLWPGSGPVEVRTSSEIDRDGAFARVLTTPEHAGTHVDAPAHFAPGGATVEAIPAERLVVPAAVLDVSEHCGSDPDYTLGLGDLEALERRDGPIEAGCAVLIRTGWDARRRERDRYLGGAERSQLRFPGLGLEAAAALVERGVVGIGIDTVGVDPGHATDFPVHHLTLPAGLWHLEGLVNLDQLPPRGARVVVGVLPLAGGSGAPARVLALVPESEKLP